MRTKHKLLIFLSISINIMFTSSALFCKQLDSFSSYKIIQERNVFRPLWEVSTTKNDDKSRREEIEALRKSEAERQENQKTAEEKAKLDNKKREIEQDYTLTGIVFENGKKQAIIQDKKGTTNFVYENDTIEDMKILSINDSKSEVVLDYQEKFTVKLQMQ